MSASGKLSQMVKPQLLLPATPVRFLLSKQSRIEPKDVVSVLRGVSKNKKLIQSVTENLMTTDWLEIDMPCTAMTFWRSARALPIENQKICYFLSAKLFEQYKLLGAQRFVLRDFLQKQKNTNTQEFIETSLSSNLERDVFASAMEREAKGNLSRPY